MRLNVPIPCLFSTGFWVGKKSLQKWKILAQGVQEQLSPNGISSLSDESTKTSRMRNRSTKRRATKSETPDETRPMRCDASPEVVVVDTDDKKGLSVSEAGSAGIDDKEKFNDDLLCEHGKDTNLPSTFIHQSLQ